MGCLYTILTNLHVTGDLDTLKQVKKDISEAKKGLECGMAFEGFTDFKEGDIIQSIQTIETPRTF
jgi:translation initiation factor IF-2